MPRRSARASNLPLTATATQPVPQPVQQLDPHQENLLLLRRDWKWAAFSQFFYTFPQVFSLDDVTIADIERDLAYETHLVLPRVMQKLLYSLSYDRKVSVDNWQTALRKQYNKRDPKANPIGPEPVPPSKRVSKEEDDQGSRDHLAEGLQEFGLEDNAEETDAKTGVSGSVEPAASTSPGPDTSSRASQVPTPMEVQEEEKTRNWFDLPVREKLESMHTLVEWQFQNPTRLRTIMKSDDEFASWRIEPIGYDSKTNGYWLIGGDRLWIQRAPPKAPRAKTLKRKRNTEPKGKSKAGSANSTNPASKRTRIDHSSDGKSMEVMSPSGRHSRAAKDQAKLKLNIQAKQLADLQREVSTNNRSSSSRASSRLKGNNTKPVGRALGTRMSARLKGSLDDEWQPIPSEWLEDVHDVKSSSPKKTGLESDYDAVSDLTDLSEDEEAESDQQVKKIQPDQPSEHEQIDSHKDQELPQDQQNFVEWETICSTLYEWEHIAERFEKATHYNEKALYKRLVNDIVPFVTQELKEIERKREVEEALAHRKRSSRIALKESEREEARLALKRKQEEEEKLSRARRMEARQQKEEAERIKRELAREQRRKEREAREESRKNPPPVQEKSAEKRDASPVSAHGSERSTTKGQANTTNGAKQKKGRSNPGKATRDDWELSCEICGRHGINLDDGTPMMSCGRCSKWQHISCHDQADRAAGRPRRNWDAVDFLCKACRSTGQRTDVYRKDMAQLPPSQYLTSSYGAHLSHARSDYQANHHPSSFTTNPLVQSYYARPNGQHVMAKEHVQQNFYTPNGNQANSSHYTTSMNRPISFSHYQPVAHGFSSSPKPYTPPYTYYGQSNANMQYIPPAPGSYSQQGTIQAWNIATPEHPHTSTSLTNGVAYSAQRLERPPEAPVNGPSHLPVQRQPDQYYPSTQYNQHTTSYQPPLGR
ncbi:hypothetical protein D9613_007673 [Agrocybe pediades]|uniref:PHD-type domain-containing protein n=1 Tax=Agrocybe pediades TaxID=84607 RepID=A0A8H4QNE8_9AGAR|nr:hypothetical protein D9613_007673 [Agrocybe pediades]